MKQISETRHEACWYGALQERLKEARFRLTQQRMTIAIAIFAGGEPRHVSALDLHARLTDAGSNISLATIYNVLNAFSERGLVRKVPCGDGNYFYDTNDSDHIHLITESRDGSRTIVDVDDLEGVIEDLKQIAAGGEDGLVIRIVL